MAEAAFSAPHDEEADAAVVVIKRRRRAVNTVGAASATTLSAATNGVREQRVFRIAPTLALGEPSATTATADLAASHAAAEAVAGSLEGTFPVARRQRRRKHGVVTVIRPERLDEQEVKGVASRELVGRHQSATVPPDFDFVEVRKRYEQLRSQIVKLEREAQKLRAREAAHAVRWIRQAIEDYGLSAKDLGFSV